MSREPDEALEVLRGVWSAQGQTGADLGGLAGHGKACKRMAGVGFEGVPGDDEDLRAAWRDKLRREGKLRPGSESVRDLVLGSAEPSQEDQAARRVPHGLPADRRRADRGSAPGQLPG